MIQNGIDEYKWWIEEAIEHGEPSEPVTLKRGGRTVREKTVLPTAESILGLWIEQFVEGGETVFQTWFGLNQEQAKPVKCVDATKLNYRLK